MSCFPDKENKIQEVTELVTKRMLVVVGMILFVSALVVPSVSATVNLTDVWDFITEITDNQSTIITLIIFGVIIYVVKRFGKALGGFLDLGMSKK